MRKWIKLALAASLVLPSDALADGDLYPVETQTSKAPAPSQSAAHAQAPKRRIEVSFGNTHLFYGTFDQALAGDLGSYVPAQSSLFILDVLADRWGGLLVFNLPWSGQPTLEDGVLIEKPISPSVSAGLRWSACRYQLDTAATIELQVAALAARSIGNENGDIFFPLLGGRLHIARPDGFSMYAGTMFALRKETLALIYGVGNRF